MKLETPERRVIQTGLWEIEQAEKNYRKGKGKCSKDRFGDVKKCNVNVNCKSPKQFQCPQKKRKGDQDQLIRQRYITSSLQ